MRHGLDRTQLPIRASIDAGFGRDLIVRRSPTS
jgi:hypothetical protein